MSDRTFISMLSIWRLFRQILTRPSVWCNWKRDSSNYICCGLLSTVQFLCTYSNLRRFIMAAVDSNRIRTILRLIYVIRCIVPQTSHSEIFWDDPGWRSALSCCTYFRILVTLHPFQVVISRRGSQVARYGPVILLTVQSLNTLTTSVLEHLTNTAYSLFLSPISQSSPVQNTANYVFCHVSTNDSTCDTVSGTKLSFKNCVHKTIIIRPNLF